MMESEHQLLERQRKALDQAWYDADEVEIRQEEATCAELIQAW